MWLCARHGFGDLISDAHDGIERRHRLLENHGDARAAKLAHGVIGKFGKIARCAVFGEEDFSGDMRLQAEAGA
jgi:hypothetical protein